MSLVMHISSASGILFLDATRSTRLGWGKARYGCPMTMPCEAG